MSLKIGRNDPCICGSGKKFENCCINEEILDLGNGILGIEKEANEEQLNKMILGEGLEDLTDALIQELVEKGWDIKLLLALRERGGKYDKESDSVFEPPIFDCV